MDQKLLNRRFSLRNDRYLSERFEISPNITETRVVLDHLHISYAAQDKSILPLVEEAYLRAYRHVKDWFNYQGDIPLDLWMAPTVFDLQYMICGTCDAGFFCAPGSRNGRGTILFVSPLACERNANRDRLAGVLAHEITHHLIEKVSLATVLTMKRKEEQRLPMWVEEGLCQLIDSTLDPAFRHKWAERIARVTKWYDLEDLWNDLSSCEDVLTAYLQAYKQTKSLVETKGKAEIIRLLHQSRTCSVDWNRLAE